MGKLYTNTKIIAVFRFNFMDIAHQQWIAIKKSQSIRLEQSNKMYKISEKKTHKHTLTHSKSLMKSEECQSMVHNSVVVWFVYYLYSCGWTRTPVLPYIHIPIHGMSWIFTEINGPNIRYDMEECELLLVMMTMIVMMRMAKCFV